MHFKIWFQNPHSRKAWIDRKRYESIAEAESVAQHVVNNFRSGSGESIVYRVLNVEEETKKLNESIGLLQAERDILEMVSGNAKLADSLEPRIDQINTVLAAARQVLADLEA